MKKAREKEERWKKERREEVERKRGRDLPLLREERSLVS